MALIPTAIEALVTLQQLQKIPFRNHFVALIVTLTVTNTFLHPFSKPSCLRASKQGYDEVAKELLARGANPSHVPSPTSSTLNPKPFSGVLGLFLGGGLRSLGTSLEG